MLLHITLTVHLRKFSSKIAKILVRPNLLSSSPSKMIQELYFLCISSVFGLFVNPTNLYQFVVELVAHKIRKYLLVSNQIIY